ncbi:signal peptidase complex subunit 3 [Enteropsectra breve]|nr:signal peptidase complex subunit 3 [Enteropsectra breve]
MQSTWKRASVFASKLMNGFMALGFAIFLVSYLSGGSNVSANLKILRFESKYGTSILSFQPNVDLTPEFKFNTKQIFLYLTYRNENEEKMVWSKTVKKGDNYRLFQKEISNTATNIKPGLHPVLELRGNIYPMIGQMRDVGYGKVDVKITQ